MITYFTAAPPADLSAVTIVRRLRWHVLTLTRQDPYYQARLCRIAAQLDYAVRSWPEEQWPLVSPDNQPVPSKKKMLALLSALASTADAQSQLLDLIRLLL